MAGFQAPITILQAIERIKRNEYLLPAFQREFVWSHEQVQMLFESIMRGYPISSMLFWKVKGETKTDFKFYAFLKSYRERYKTHNDLISTDGVNDFHAVLDGQQRLTALYIGLAGTYAYKMPRRWWSDDEHSIPTRSLYLNISTVNSPDSEQQYLFEFLQDSITNCQDLIPYKDDKWFRVGRILQLAKGDGVDVYSFAEEFDLNSDERRVLRKLENRVARESIINFYEEDEQLPDKAVNIFIRINSGGTPLSFSDILFSIAVANWKTIDARTEINNLVDNILSKGFNVDKDYVLKAFLYLYHKDVGFKITSFNSEFMETIESNWSRIRDAITSLFDLIKACGFNISTLTANNATLPILYYIYHNDIYKDFDTRKPYQEDRALIKQWLLGILVRRVFGSQADTVLMQTRRGFTNDFENVKIQNDVTVFPASEINIEIKKLGDIGEDFLEGLLETQKDTRYSFAILALLYPQLDYRQNNFHQDHLHPLSMYDDLSEEDKEIYGWDVYNSILNLQMLDANENMSKQDEPLGQWVNSTAKELNIDRKVLLNKQLIPDVDLSLASFGEFIEARKKLLKTKLIQALGID